MNLFCNTTQMASFSRLLPFFYFFMISITCLLSSRGCNEVERKALLDIKSNVVDPSGRLSSWQESIQHRNCCSWDGIQCSGESFHVISIDLRNKDLEMYRYDGSSYAEPETALQGILSPSIFNITQLEYLDLGFNDFQGSEISNQFSYLTKLTHLDLSLSNFSASISTQFNNLTFLQYLDLSCYQKVAVGICTTPCLRSSTTKWLRGLVNLQVLRLAGIDISEATSSKDNFAQHISCLWNLRDLDISDCNISDPVFAIHNLHNMSRLSSLKMNDNRIKSSVPLELANLTSLSILELSSCGLHGSIPYLSQLKELDVSSNSRLKIDLTRMFEHPLPRLRILDISDTNAGGSIPSTISNAPLLVSLSASWCSIQGSLPSSIYSLSRLQHLDFSYNNISGSINSSISNLKDLNFLDLSENKLQGSIPNSICEIFPLRHLDLRDNNITGTIPCCIRKLRNLSVFDVSFNSIRGTVSLISFINELDLTFLDLGANNLTVVTDQHLHPSKFILEVLRLGLCNMKGFIPTFICNFTYLQELDLSYNNLTGAIPICISTLKKLTRLDLSGNRLSGPLPLLPPSVHHLDLSNNKLNGEISRDIGERLSSVSSYDLNNNELSGSIPSSICSQKPDFSYTTLHIKLFNNKLSGTIPSSIGYCTNLFTLYLGNNSLTGNVPNELKHTKLTHLELNDNNLNGTLPMFIQKFLTLEILNLGNNNFEGSIPTGLGSLSILKILNLRSNRLSGSIPQELFYLQQLQIIDLSINNLSGPIPLKLGNLTRLTTRFSGTIEYLDSVQYQLAIKGTRTQFKWVDLSRTGIDLSCNTLAGNIPAEIGLLKGLVMLNLSYNLFSGYIPASVGNMSSLESLDLRTNRLSGHIPQSLTSIDSLEVLNLSDNNLSSRIPRGNHFDTLSLDGSAFAGNDLLCGFPLAKDCEDNHSPDSSSSKFDVDDQEDGKEKFLLYAIIAMGCAVGFWGLFFVLLLKKQKWWFPYWKIIDSVAVKIVEGCVHKN